MAGDGDPRLTTRWRWSLLVLVVGVLAGALVVSWNLTARDGADGPGLGGNPQYADQHRTAEWLGNREGVLTPQQVEDLARTVDYLVMTKFSADFDLEAQFAQAAAVEAAAAKLNRTVKVFPYFSASFWFQANTAWGRYASGFKPEWYLRDARGDPIVFTGPDSEATMVDLRNPEYRSWAVATVMAWMADAPVAGVALDSANVLVGSTVRRNIGDGRSSYNDLLCGPGAAVDTGGTCSVVRDWNEGLSSLVTEMRAAVGTRGGEVLYNGVSPHPTRPGDRNLGLLAAADGAVNESFCYTATSTGPTFTSVTDDAEMMRTTADRGKKLIEVTNHFAPGSGAFAEYCAAAFLIGWQPGSSYWVYHAEYEITAETTDLGSQVPEQNLTLGRPSTPGYVADGAVLTREFQHGAVVVNTSDSAASFTAPQDVTRYFGGEAVASYDAGETVALPPRSGAMLVHD